MIVLAIVGVALLGSVALALFVGKMIAVGSADPVVGGLPRHQWTGWIPVDEPGISDVDGGRWARCEVICSVCEETRRVWHAVPPEQLNASICPGRRPV